MNTICLVLDCLHPGFLGPYGNTWIHSPSFDLLASQAFTFDYALVDSPHLESLYRSYWQFTHALRVEHDEKPLSLPVRLREAGLSTVLMTDEPAVADHPLAVHFDQRVPITSPRELRIAEQLDDTYLASCFAGLVEWLDRAPDGFFLWCHLAGMGRVWDAPMEYREAYRVSGDPRPFADFEVPDRRLPADYDPDELFSIVQAYAGQLTLLDRCMGGLLKMIDNSSLGSETLLVVLGARGFPLGEHRRVGFCDSALYGELVHIPVFLRLPNGLGAAGRSHALLQSADLSATLLDVNGLSLPKPPRAASLLPIVRGEQERLHECVVIAGTASERAIRTPAWYLRRAERAELYLKPDDRWEANDVANRCGEIVEQLDEAMTNISHAIQDPHAAPSPQISDILISGLE